MRVHDYACVSMTKGSKSAVYMFWGLSLLRYEESDLYEFIIESSDVSIRNWIEFLLCTSLQF